MFCNAWNYESNVAYHCEGLHKCHEYLQRHDCEATIVRTSLEALYYVSCETL
jgi:hypothetical protein